MPPIRGCASLHRARDQSRREFLRAGGLGLPTLLEARDLTVPVKTFGPSFGRAKACILLFMWGGPAQNDGLTNVSVYWDTHSRNFIDLKTRLMPAADQAFSALLDDLDARGLLDETLIVWTGEFGRTPRVGQSIFGGAGAGKDGRDHWPHCFSTVLAGPGIKGGTVHGASDRWAAHPALDPVTPADVVATVYHALGVDPTLEIRDTLGRPAALCLGRPIGPVLA